MVQKKGIQRLSSISRFNMCSVDSLFHSIIESFNAGILGDFTVVDPVGRKEVLNFP